VYASAERCWPIKPLAESQGTQTEEQLTRLLFPETFGPTGQPQIISGVAVYRRLLLRIPSAAEVLKRYNVEKGIISEYTNWKIYGRARD
jgi:hypothetical protein